jgi:predicted enzyme related to lactoylglutathione lyase
MADALNDDSRQMPIHGAFCWTEIASTDLGSCRSFYSNVFGWKFEQSNSAGSEIDYLEFASAGGEEKDGALYEMQPMMFGGSIPPAHIALYVSVDNVDEAAQRAVELGGSVTFEPYDIPNVGRMAVISDPTGASMSIITLNDAEAGE